MKEINEDLKTVVTNTNCDQFYWILNENTTMKRACTAKIMSYQGFLRADAIADYQDKYKPKVNRARVSICETTILELSIAVCAI